MTLTSKVEEFHSKGAESSIDYFELVIRGGIWFWVHNFSLKLISSFEVMFYHQWTDLTTFFCHIKIYIVYAQENLATQISKNTCSTEIELANKKLVQFLN